MPRVLTHTEAHQRTSDQRLPQQRSASVCPRKWRCCPRVSGAMWPQFWHKTAA